MPRDPAGPPSWPSPHDAGLVELRGRVLSAGGVDIALYRDACVLRRLEARLRAVGAADVAGYCRRLEADPGELHRLVRALTVNVSEFFRNPATFRALQRTVFPALVAQRLAEGGRSIRIWSAGCATGEEAYSLGMLASDVLGEGPGRLSPVIFATDVDQASLAAARAGRYRASSVLRVPRHLLRRHFVPDDGGYQVRESIRHMVHFRRHDLATPFPFRRMDMVVCRNVMIYMVRPLQERLLAGFYDALNPGGVLVLGKVEGLVGPGRDRYEVVNLAERIYRKPLGASPVAGAATHREAAP